MILNAFLEQGATVDAIRVIGGGAKGRLWRQIMANIYNKPILRPTLLAEATSLGAAIAGGIGIGFFKDYSIAESLTPIIETLTPDPEIHKKYETLYPLFNELYETLVPMYDKLASIQKI